MHSRLALAGLLVALLLGGALRWTMPERLADLRPRPDALEYEEGARALASGDGYALRIGAERYPPRYPPGFSLLLAPVVGAFPASAGVGVWVVLASALAAIVAVCWLGLRAGGAPSAVAAALLLALLPIHVRWSRAVMSDVPTATAVAWLAVWALGAIRRSARAAEWLALGVASGLATLLRMAALDAAPASLALLLVDRRLSAGGRVARAAAFLGGIALGALPLLGWNQLLFGSPLRTGYDYWVPSTSFGRSFLLGPVSGGQVGNLPFYAGSLAGLGRAYPLPIALLIALGFVVSLRSKGEARRLGVLALGVLGAMLAIQLPYFWQAERYLMPAMPLLCAVAAMPFGGAASPRLRAVAAALGIAAVALIARNPQGLEPADHEMLDARTLAAVDAVAEPNAALVAHTNPFLFGRLLRAHGDRVWVPIGLDEHRWRAQRLGLAPLSTDPPPVGVWIRPALGPPIDASAVRATLDALLAEGRPVYFSTQLASEMSLFLPRLRDEIEKSYALEPVLRVGPGEVYRLRKRESIQ